MSGIEILELRDLDGQAETVQSSLADLIALQNANGDVAARRTFSIRLDSGDVWTPEDPSPGVAHHIVPNSLLPESGLSGSLHLYTDTAGAELARIHIVQG